MARQSDARARMIGSAIQLQRQHGLAATSFNDVLTASGAPRGSLYHHFPGGRAQLAHEATEAAADAMAALLRERIEGAEDPIGALDAFVGEWIAAMQADGARIGCPLAAAALDPDAGSAAAEAGARGLAELQAVIAEAAESAGLAPGAATDFATLALSSIEGALILDRVSGETEALDSCRRSLMSYLEHLSAGSAGERVQAGRGQVRASHGD